MAHIILPLQPDGALLTIGIAVSQEREEVLLSEGLPVSPPIHVQALIDTGASCTCVEARVLKKLGLVPSGTAQIHTPSTRGVAVDVDQYDVTVVLYDQHGSSLVVGTIPIIEASLGDCDALIGRDVLRLALLIYDGIAGQFTLAF